MPPVRHRGRHAAPLCPHTADAHADPWPTDAPARALSVTDNHAVGTDPETMQISRFLCDAAPTDVSVCSWPSMMILAYEMTAVVFSGRSFSCSEFRTGTVPWGVWSLFRPSPASVRACIRVNPRGFVLLRELQPSPPRLTSLLGSPLWTPGTPPP